MERREISVGVGETVLVNGRKIITNIIKYNVGVIPSETAEHETDHGLVAELTGSAIRMMTINPGPGYLGKTEFSSGKLNPVSAAAAASRHRRGTGWDKFITVVHGHDWEGSKSAAIEILDANHKEHQEIAKELEVEKTLTSCDIWRVIDRTRNPKAKVTEYDDNGKEIRSMVQTIRKVDGKVSIFLSEPVEDRIN